MRDSFLGKILNSWGQFFARTSLISAPLKISSDALTFTNVKTRGGCAADLKTMLTGEWQESARVKGKLLSIGYGLATVSRAAAQLVLSGAMQQDKRGRLTFWRAIPARTVQAS